MPYEPLHHLNFVKQPTIGNTNHPANRGKRATRTCKDCHEPFPLNARYFYLRSPGRYSCRCKKCHNKKRAEYKRSPLSSAAREHKARYKRQYTRRKYIEIGKPPAPRHYWTVQRAAAELEIDPRRCYELIWRGELSTVRHFGRWLRVNPAEVRRLLEKGQAT